MKQKILLLFTVLFSSTFFCQSNQETKLIGKWKVFNGEIENKKSKYTARAKEEWKRFYTIFPKKLTNKYIKKIVLISDGLDEKTGALGALTVENNKWELVLDTIDVNFKTKDTYRLHQSVYTLVHEFGHLLTLNKEQVVPSYKEFQEEGGPYLTEEGEAKKNSYINLFVKKFWTQKLLKRWDEIKETHKYDSKKMVDELFVFYQNNKDVFLTDYAAESPEEDIAESWTAFVLKDRVENPLTIAEEKINFFYQFSVLINYRKIIRKNTRKYLQQNL
ncbi:hypothetical protein WH52_00240 [Tenacibaculum holothuriorum]|uniref:Uncharacterized protein n=1 Tax=Tenacibaculum holothuriorum TaxID=1635173 RepID=A0A1Y2PF49_9FLAO|nr:hypothetical protein [Tenacibaculum holothuriorum]OSY89124.1 hypothetical protein WH52_00240 [Tenacibaculum holothuriorum]